jgi:acyl-CoA hydrolase
MTKTAAAAIDIASQIREGDTIAWSSAAAEPTALLKLLDAQMDHVPACRAFIGLSVSTTLDAARMVGRMRAVTLGGAGTNQRFAAAGNMDVLPVHYSALPRLVVDGHLKFDVVLVQLATDGAAHRLSLMTDYLTSALPRARVVIAEVNDQAPCVLGDTAVSAADIDHVVHVSHPPVEIPATMPGDAARAIGAHVARLIGDGATLQVGLGALPDACLMALSGKRDLGLHSGVIGDRAADLVEAGNITNRRKPLDTGLSVTAGLLGTQRLYRWAHRHPTLRMRNAVYTHDTANHAQLPNLIGINSALEVDLTGQMNAEVAGGRSIGMIGGHGDFMRGCQRSPGGRAILALEATARGGKVSRIVPRLPDGIVTSSRSDADVVVSEYGIAELRGRTVSERARALIAIAHPDFRKDLQAAAEQLV